MLELSETTIYRADQRLFVTHSDHNLIEIVGDDVPFLEVILREGQAGGSIQSIKSKLYNDFEVQENYATQLIDWLVDNGILQRHPDSDCIERNAYIFAPVLTKEQKNELCATISDEQLIISLSDSIETANIVLFISPILEHLTDFETTNQAAYEAGIISFHFGADLQSFTVGPLCIPAQQTPCLHCYVQRKLVNMRNLKKTLQFIHYPNRQLIHQHSPVNNPIFQLGLTHVKHELSRILRADYIRSALTARSVVYDMVYHETQASQILKMPFCPVCAKRTPFYAPFNG